MQDQDTFLIKNYLLGLLSVQQRQELEHRLNNDVRFAEELRFHRALFAELERKEMLELKKMLQQEESKYQKPPKNRWPIIVLLALLAVVAIYWFFNPDPSELQTPKQQALEQASDTTLQHSKDTSLPAPTAKPLADASKFTPNAAWEAQINSQLRGTGVDSLALTNPPPNAVWPVLNKNRVDFKGVLFSERNEMELLLSLFNNRDTKPILTRTTTFTKRLGQFEYNQSVLIQQGPGLYYFSIEDATDGTVLKSGKFTFK